MDKVLKISITDSKMSRYHFADTRMAKNKKTNKKKTHKKQKQRIPSIHKDVGKLKPLHINDGNVKGCSHFGKQFHNSSKS